MNKQAVLAICACLAMLGVGAVYADDNKDESGKGKQQSEKRQSREGKTSYFHQQNHTRIPKGHMPPAGECRIWYPNRPAGQQPPPFKCGQSPARVEPGGWMFSPGPRRQEVEVSVYDDQRPGIVIDVGIFDARTGSLIRVVGAR